MYIKLFFISFLVLLTSCSISKPLNEAVTTAEQLVYYYDGDITSLLQNADLSQVEMQTIQNSILSANRIRMQFEQYKDSPSTIPNNLRLVEIEYNRLKNAYSNVREIAVRHRNEYPVHVWETFEIFDIFAKELDVQFVNLVETTKMNEAIVNSIQLANSIIRIAALL